jgi:hypothetical protein
MEECLICFEETTDFVFFPCAHKVCSGCHKRIVRCPICNYVDPEIQIVQRVQIVQPQKSACSRICAFFVLTFVLYGVYHSLSQSDP